MANSVMGVSIWCSFDANIGTRLNEEKYQTKE